MIIPTGYSFHIKNKSSAQEAKYSGENEEPVKVRKSEDRNDALPLMGWVWYWFSTYSKGFHFLGSSVFSLYKNQHF